MQWQVSVQLCSHMFLQFSSVWFNALRLQNKRFICGQRVSSAISTKLARDEAEDLNKTKKHIHYVC